MKSNQTLLALALLSLSAAFYPTLRWLAVSWTHNEYYSHGWPLFVSAAVLLGWVSRKFQVSAWNADACAMRLGGAAVVVLAVGLLTGLNALKAWAALLFLALSLEAHLGRKWMDRAWAPFILLAMAVPIPFLPDIVGGLIRLNLLGLSAGAALFNFPLRIEGAMAIVPEGRFLIGGACSGFHSIVVLMPLLFFGSLVAGDGGKRAGIAAIGTVPMALMANGLRIVAPACLRPRLGRSGGHVVLAFTGFFVILFFGDGGSVGTSSVHPRQRERPSGGDFGCVFDLFVAGIRVGRLAGFVSVRYRYEPICLHLPRGANDYPN